MSDVFQAALPIIEEDVKKAEDAALPELEKRLTDVETAIGHLVSKYFGTTVATEIEALLKK